MYKNTKEFVNELVSTFEILLDISRMGGDSGIANKRRQETYKKAIDIINNADTDNDISVFVKLMETSLTEKPKKFMKELLAKGILVLDKKPPYNGIIIKRGKIVDNDIDSNIEAFKNLSVLTGIGIGLGDSGTKELVKMGFKHIEQLQKEYDENKFVNFRKGLQGPLCRYFEGTVRIEKMTREEATKWRDVISKIVTSVVAIENPENAYNVEHKIAGSYARKQEMIGDIDYIIVVNSDSNQELYNIMMRVLDDLSEVTDIGNLPVELDLVSETPSRPNNTERYATSIKMWFKVGILKTKIEIYGYTNCEFVFPYFARSAEVNLQKKIKIHASKRGFRLSPYGLFLSNTDEEVSSQVIFNKIGKNQISTIRNLFDFLEYSSCNN
jgi:DNA polymerase/3'-5' exonuclease PolX